jgi:cytochrome c553
MKRLFTMVSILAMALASGAVFAAGNAAAGKEKSQTCAGCHSATGDSTNPQFPKLAGQHDDYIVRALSEYKSGARKNPIMKGFAAGLSTQDMEDLAAYFSSQAPGVVSPHFANLR